MKIKRGGKIFKLSEQEMHQAYYEMQGVFMREDVENQLNEACSALKLSIPGRAWKQLVEKATAIYNDYESDNESWLDNCRLGINEAAGEIPVLARRTALRLKNYF